MERLVRGDIIVIDFPYSDLVSFKRRPVLIIKVPAGDDVLVCQITSDSFEESVEIPIKIEDFQRGHLQRQSYVRLDKLFSVEKSMINYKIGSLKQEKFKAGKIQRNFRQTH